jgi:hypothetical protein
VSGWGGTNNVAYLVCTIPTVLAAAVSGGAISEAIADSCSFTG